MNVVNGLRHRKTEIEIDVCSAEISA